MYSAYINLTEEHEFCAGYHNFGKGVCPVSWMDLKIYSSYSITNVKDVNSINF